jgi:tetratricopeptide (TPR) repeat protein
MIVSNPHDAEAHCNRGVALDALQKYEEAIECYRSALSLKPDFIQPLFNMGNACLSLGNLDGAGACYERVLQFTPNFVQAHLRLGDIAKTGREYASAHVHYQNAFFLDPSCVDALQGIAEIYLAEEKFDDAITAYKKVVTSAPERSDAWNMLGTAYHSIERHADAEACYRKALALLPESVTICNNLGVELNDQGRLAEAISVYRHLLEVDTNYADGHWNLAVALLTTGNYSEGWREYEWRFKKSGPVPDRDFVQPRWDGSPLKGRTILLHAEQGFGDTIQLARYVPLVVERGGNVILECQVPALKRLLTSLNGITEVVVAGDPLPQFHCHLPLMSLPLIFETTMATIPRDIPYLAAQVEDIEEWQKRLGAPGSFRVGLVWSGRQSQLLNRKRSCPLENFAPLATIPNIDFYSLQVGDAFVQLNTGDPDFRLIDLTANIDDFSDTAAFIANLDLVITIDTAVAHLAGAVGAQTWVLLPHGADWRWQCDRADSPWYPTIRLFRQTSPGDWPSLINIVTAALHGSVNGKNRIPDIFPSSVFGNRRYA